MPNFQCERCEQHMCRVKCSECDKHVCDPCRLVVRHNYVCQICYARRMPVIRMNRQIIKRDSHMLWSSEVTAELDAMYAARGRPFGIQPYSAVITDHTWRTVRNHAGHTLRDSYTRIGKHYTCVRDLVVEGAGGNLRLIRLKLPMYLSDDQKESIAAAAMHPSRLQKWLDRGWEEDWFDYFG